MILKIISISVNLISDKIDCIREKDIFICELATYDLLQVRMTRSKFLRIILMVYDAKAQPMKPDQRNGDVMNVEMMSLLVHVITINNSHRPHMTFCQAPGHFNFNFEAFKVVLM